jgi:hypothetical protein
MRIPRLTEGHTLARQSHRLRSTSRHSRRVTVLAATAALCLAATGAAATFSAATVSWSPHTSPVDAVDMLYIQHLHPAQPGAPAQPQVQVGVTGQLVLMQAARRAAADRAAAAAAAHAAASLLAAQQAAARRAARQAAARRAAALAAAEQAAQQAAQQPSVTVQSGPAPPAATPAPPAAPPVSGSPQQIAQQLLAQYGWAGQFSCLDSLWERESGWNPAAENPTSGAFGIPQALPAAKMASAGADWATDAATQIRWGLSYIRSTYGSPCGAWAHEEADGWY